MLNFPFMRLHCICGAAGSLIRVMALHKDELHDTLHCRCTATVALEPSDDMYMVIAFFDETAFAQQHPDYRIRPRTLGVVLVTYCSAGDGGARHVRLCILPAMAVPCRLLLICKHTPGVYMSLAAECAGDCIARERLERAQRAFPKY